MTRGGGPHTINTMVDVATAPSLLPTLDNARTRELDKKHVLHSWSAQNAINPPPVTEASGVRMTVDGTSYIDFTSQLVNVNIGYQHPKLVAAIQEQAGRLMTVSPAMANDMRSEAARVIAEVAPDGMNMVFFTNGGAEANENAIRMARLHTGRHKVLAAYRSYHGATHGAITLTGEPRRFGSEPGIPGVVHFFGPYLYRSPFHATTEAEEGDRALQHLREVMVAEGTDKIAAIILETIVGTNGILMPPDGYLRGVRELCDEFGILLIADEVMAGFARTGEWFAINHWDVVPDLISFAKGVNSGYVPLGGVILSDAVAGSFMDTAYPGGLTYSGHPLACASAVASVSIMKEEGIVEHARDLGERVIGPKLRELAQAHRSVGEVRGIGVFWALELVTDPDARTPLTADQMNQVAAACKGAGMWPFIAGNRVHIVPPCVITEEEFAEGVRALEDGLAVADGFVAGS
ncbi:Aminotransferase class-III [Nostocoides australiense Ben110]|uniref:Aminotransferase class-III n=2 Tax=Nostocoides australiense TaxID=99480 RepID=W6JY38_9MICO|nr:Aminotransferase class-III [Tetrasphaera australiensis Ben110]